MSAGFRPADIVSTRHSLFILAGKHQPLLFGIGQFASSFAAFLDFQGCLGRGLFIKGGVSKLFIKGLNQLLKLCRQGFDIVDLFAKRGERGALFGVGLALVRF